MHHNTEASERRRVNALIMRWFVRSDRPRGAGGRAVLVKRAAIHDAVPGTERAHPFSGWGLHPQVGITRTPGVLTIATVQSYADDPSDPLTQEIGMI